MNKKKTVDERKEAFARWTRSDEGKAFHAWWKNHRYSGYTTNRFGRERFGILPYEAWFCWKYQAEFFVEHGEQFPWPENLARPQPFDIEKWDTEKQQYPEVEELVRAIRIQWRQAQKKVERYSKKLGTTFNTEHNQKVYQTIQTEYGNADGFGFNELGKAWKVEENDSAWTEEAMRTKIDKAYAYESGQSEEETELLKRRRDDD